MTTKARNQSRLKRSKCYVFTRDDFKDLAGYDQIGRALHELVKEGLLLKVDYRLVGATSAYNSGKSTQIPAPLEIKTSPRFKRALSVGNSKLNG